MGRDSCMLSSPNIHVKMGAFRLGLGLGSGSFRVLSNVLKSCILSLKGLEGPFAD